MTDPKTTCICNHPASEHHKVEGLHGLGHCKVPGCGCGAFAAAGNDTPPQVQARHTLVARATNADGTQGINLTAPGGPGVAMSVPDEVAMALGKEAQQQYRNLFGEDAVHVGVAGLPFMQDQDMEVGGENMPVEPGMHIKARDGGEATLEDAIEAVKEGGPIIQKIPLDSLRPRDKLLAALYLIDIELSARVLLDEFETPEARAELATKLTTIGSDKAIELANRIRAGEFDGAS